MCKNKAKNSVCFVLRGKSARPPSVGPTHAGSRYRIGKIQVRWPGARRCWNKFRLNIGRCKIRSRRRGWRLARSTTRWTYRDEQLVQSAFCPKLRLFIHPFVHSSNSFTRSTVRQIRFVYSNESNCFQYGSSKWRAKNRRDWTRHVKILSILSSLWNTETLEMKSLRK